MDINSQAITGLLSEILNESVVLPSDIPDIDLYIDQITTLFDDKIKNSKRTEDDKLITKTMVNNYSKAGIIKPIKGKKYSKEHIIQMLIIYQMKQIISINDIKTVFDDCRNEESSLINTYAEFTKTKQLQAQQAEEFVNTILSREDSTDSTINQKLLLVMTLCSMSNYFKRMAEKIIDCYTEEKSL